MTPAWRSAAPVLGLAGGGALLYFARGVLVPFLLAAVVAYTLHPAVAWLERTGVKRSLGVLLLFAALILAAAGVAALVIPEVIGQCRSFLEKVPGYQEELRRRFEPAILWLDEKYPGQVEALRAQLLDSARGALPAIGAWIASTVQGIFTSLVRVIVSALSIVVIPVFAAYLLIDYRELRAAVEAVIPAEFRPGVSRRVSEVDQVLRAWLKGQLTVASFLAILYAIGLSLLGVPLGLLIGVIGGLANLVPYLGLVIGFIPAAALALLDTGSWVAPAGVAAVFIVGQVLESTLITPRVVGVEVGLPPALIMLSVLVGGDLFGFTGLLLAVPVTAAALVLLKDFRRAYDASGAASVAREQRRQVRRPLRRTRGTS